MNNENRLKPVSPAGIKLRKCGEKTLLSGEKKIYYKKMQLYIYSCSCGKFCTKVKYDVDSGNTKSCGCLNKELRIKHLNKLRREYKEQGKQLGFQKGHKLGKGKKGRPAHNKGKIFLPDKPNLWKGGKFVKGDTGRYVTMQELTELYYSKDVDVA